MSVSDYKSGSSAFREIHHGLESLQEVLNLSHERPIVEMITWLAFKGLLKTIH